MRVQTFTIQGIDIDVMYNKGTLAYIFRKEGREYGISTKVPDRKVETVVAATVLLVANALETNDKLNDNTRTGKKD